MYSSIYRGHVCGQCSMCDSCGHCNADVNDGYMCDSITGEIIDDAVIVNDCGDEVPTCERAAWYVSEYCEDDGVYHTDYIQTEDTNTYYSLNYAECHLYQCEDCGVWFEDIDNMRSVRGSWYCSDCAQSYSIITYYHDHKYSYEPVGGSWDNDLIGFELETDGYEDGGQECAAIDIDSTFNRGRDVLAFEQDCSLYSGVEIISHPHTLDALDALDIESICDICIDNGADPNPGTAGLHLHFSRSWFGADAEEQAETIGRMVALYCANWDALCELSRRPSMYQIDEYAGCPRYYGGGSWAEVAEDCRNGGRYQAINLCPSKTVEFRLGGGCLDPDYIRSWVHLHVLMIEAARAGQDFTVLTDYTIGLIEAAA